MKYHTISNLIKRFNLWHAVGMSLGVHLIMAAVFPTWFFSSTPVIEKKEFKKVRLNIVKKPEIKALPKLKPLRPVSQKIIKLNILPAKPIVLPRVIQNPIALVASKQVPKIIQTTNVQQVAAMPITKTKAIKQVTMPKAKVASQAATTNVQFQIAARPTQTNRNVSVQRVAYNSSGPIQMPPYGSSSQFIVAPKPIQSNGMTATSTTAHKIHHGSSSQFIVAPKPIQSNGMTATSTTAHKIHHSGARMTQGFAVTYRQPRSIKEISRYNRGNRSSRLKQTNSHMIALAFQPIVLEVAALSPQETFSRENTEHAFESYITEIRKMIAQAKQYPSSARDKGREGKVILAFNLGKNGSVLDLTTVRSSGYEILDKAGMQAIKNAAPYPAIPKQLKRNSLLLKLPISFILR